MFTSLRTIAVSALIATSTATLASAGDAPAPTWTGIYFGGGLGYQSTDISKWSNTNLLPAAPAYGNLLPLNPPDQSPDSGFASIHLGYQQEIGHFSGGALVAGVEGSAGTPVWDDRGSKGTACYYGLYSCSAEVGRTLTIGGRIGFGIGQVLIYGQGGYANTEFRSKLTQSFLLAPVVAPAAPALGQTLGFATNADGFYWGGGIDVALHDNWILGVDYRHFDLGTVDQNNSSNLYGIGNHSFSAESDVVQARLSYRFYKP